MNKLHEYMKANHDMKTFTHVPQEKKIINLKTETIKGKRFYVLPNGNKYPSITTVLSDRGNAGILKWRESVGEQVANTIMRNAASRGTAVPLLAAFLIIVFAACSPTDSRHLVIPSLTLSYSTVVIEGYF